MKKGGANKFLHNSNDQHTQYSALSREFRVLYMILTGVAKQWHLQILNVISQNIHASSIRNKIHYMNYVCVLLILFVVLCWPTLPIPCKVTLLTLRHTYNCSKSYEINGSLQERHNSIAKALELRISCTNPSKWGMNNLTWTKKHNRTMCKFYRIYSTLRFWDWAHFLHKKWYLIIRSTVKSLI